MRYNVEKIVRRNLLGCLQRLRMRRQDNLIRSAVFVNLLAVLEITSGIRSANLSQLLRNVGLTLALMALIEAIIDG